LKKLVSRGAFEGVFDSVESDVEELLSILLLGSIGWASIEFLEREAELPWIVVVPLRELEISHEPLQLVEDIVVDLLAFILFDLLRLAVVHAE
jgi:hypothetical protein